MSVGGVANASGMADFSAIRRYNAFLLLVAGLGGLLYGVDVGIIGGALPYLEATSGLTASQLSRLYCLAASFRPYLPAFCRTGSAARC
jgi:hypothetical protein